MGLYQDPTDSIDVFINENINVDADQPIETDEIDQDTGLKFSPCELTKDDPNPFGPGGRLVRVILVAVVCNKPAAHKVGGFGSHFHTNLCTCWWITQGEKDSAKAFVKDAFLPCTNEQQQDYGDRYRKLPNATTCKNFVKEYAMRYTQLLRLPYFNLVEQVVTDPMHNLFLGLIKSHFYNIWVQSKILRPNYKLKVFHELLLILLFLALVENY
ncbi:hypothetical protein SERLADRAFT_432160 [Serpula lacrymans var. lacrymans S7.9]|uniref:Uncharacterized protein n=1 Tax=Serpula lacrymans var. lacrymans (strain S7.9) TaxID=578457 RepID=F8NEF4_SERL9|nr:uncharacterized protein SERLADRAFT_432160 [Serpula lacrymans var. lacrymans S7.9]EGO30588.1 hypothetical protein SERLADRAFT_432160 [Serpula lacrymans var. lacrymans S7.9]